jgi:hypothetical protein
VEIPAAFRRDMIDRNVWAAALAIVKRYGAAMQAAR